MLGRISRASPQFISISDGSWLGTSACIERMTQMSSMHAADVREELADLDAALAVLLELERRREGGAGLAFGAQVGRRQRLAGVLLARAGLGSKVSTCDGPPFMNRWMTRLALAGKCGFFGASGLRLVAASARDSKPQSCNNAVSPMAPKPMPQRHSSSRRVSKRCSSGC